jgi:peptide/nickel transport system permease protein
MTAESQRDLIAAVRKVVFAGIVIMLAWLVLLGLRGAISVDAITGLNKMIQQGEQNSITEVSLNPWSWDWSKSLWTGESVAGTISQRLWPTLGFIGVTAAFSLLLALIFLFIGRLISRATERPLWLVKTRGILRILLLCLAVSAPVFTFRSLTLVYPAVWWGVPENSPWVFIISVVSASLLPAWLLVQHGHSEISKWIGTPGLFDGSLWGHLGISLFIRILKLAGAIIVISMFVGLSTSLSGMGRIFIDAISMRDFPIVYATIFTVIVIVVLFKLVAELIEIAYHNYHRTTVSSEPIGDLPSTGFRIPRWLMITSLALVAVSVLVAIFAPLIAPFHYNEMTLAARLAPPSSTHILGTDNLGRDIFSRLLFGIRLDVFLSLIAVGLIFLVVIAWSILGAYVRRSNNWHSDTLEDIVMLPRDLLYSCPWLIMLLFLTSLIGMDSGTTTSYILPIALFTAIALLPRMVGIIQEAFHSAPAGRGWLGSVLMSLPVAIFFAVSGGILYISAASYLGFGVPPPAPELGGMLSGASRRYFLEAPWLAGWPPATLVLLMTVWVLAGQTLLERFGYRTKAVWFKIWE